MILNQINKSINLKKRSKKNKIEPIIGQVFGTRMGRLSDYNAFCVIKKWPQRYRILPKIEIYYKSHFNHKHIFTVDRISQFSEKIKYFTK